MNSCKNCGYNNPKDNFICENEDCGIPMDLIIEFDNELPIIKIIK